MDGFVGEPGVRGSADVTAGVPLALAVFPTVVCALGAEGAFNLQPPKSWKCSNTIRDIRAAEKPLPVEQERCHPRPSFLLSEDNKKPTQPDNVSSASGPLSAIINMYCPLKSADIHYFHKYIFEVSIYSSSHF